MNQTILLVIIASAVVLLGVLLLPTQTTPQNDQSLTPNNQAVLSEENQRSATDEQIAFAECLVDAGVVIYVSQTCPACAVFAQQLGGYDVAEDLFVECGQSPEICSANMQTNYVPEIQVDGTVLEASDRLAGLVNSTGCQL